MVNHKRLKTAIIGIGALSVILSTTLIASTPSAHAASVQTANEQAISAITSQQKADKIIAKAKSLIGKVKYKYGVNSPKTLTFDCSAFMKYIFAAEGVNLKWGSTAQSKQGTYVSKSNLQKGDLVFLSVNTSGKINHVGVYIGDGKFIHNTTGSVMGVTIGDLNSDSYKKRYITARRVL